MKHNLCSKILRELHQSVFIQPNQWKQFEKPEEIKNQEKKLKSMRDFLKYIFSKVYIKHFDFTFLLETCSSWRLLHQISTEQHFVVLFALGVNM